MGSSMEFDRGLCCRPADKGKQIWGGGSPGMFPPPVHASPLPPLNLRRRLQAWPKQWEIRQRESAECNWEWEQAGHWFTYGQRVTPTHARDTSLTSASVG